MTHVPASSRGTTFNGGTITQPLVIALTDPSSIPLSIRASWNAQNVDFLNVVNTDTGTRMFAVDVQGQTLAFPHTSEATAALAVNGSTPPQCNLGGAGIVGSFVAGAQRIGLFSAPAAVQPTLASGTATPEQIALALQSYGAAGGT